MMLSGLSLPFRGCITLLIVHNHNTKNKEGYYMNNTISIAFDSRELINQYQHLSSGHFFDRSTMRFFDSRVTSNYRRLDEKTALFITTEKMPDGNRKATIRRAEIVEYKRESDGRCCHKIVIKSVSEFNTMTLEQAKRVMRNL